MKKLNGPTPFILIKGQEEGGTSGLEMGAKLNPGPFRGTPEPTHAMGTSPAADSTSGLSEHLS